MNELDDHKKWLAETWQMIEKCAVSLNPMERVSLSPAGCIAILEERAASPPKSTVEEKLATMVWYLQAVRAGQRRADPKAFESYLDDPEVCNWLEHMSRANRVHNTRFISD